MPEYLAPGVYVEETTFRQKSIEGVSTSTCGFVGPTRFGPLEGEPEILTSFLDFERIYGGIDQLEFIGATPSHNDMAHAVRAFFENGGRRLYVARTFAHPVAPDPTAADPTESHPDHGQYLVNPLFSGPNMLLRSRYPGEAGNFVVEIGIKIGQDIRRGLAGSTVLQGPLPNDTVLLQTPGSPPTAEIRTVHRHTENGVDTHILRDPSNPAGDIVVIDGLADGIQVYVITLSVTVAGMGRFVDERTWDGLGPDPAHREALTRTFAADPPTRATALFVPLVIADHPTNGADILEAIASDFDGTASAPVGGAADLIMTNLLPDAGSAPTAIALRRQLQDGTDGNRPPNVVYQGSEDPISNVKSGLRAFEDLEDISIVAAPGSTRDALTNSPYENESLTIQQLLIGHCERMRYRIAVLDSVDGQLISDARNYRAGFDSHHAALYYPWVRIQDPITDDEIILPPSGFVTGIYARNDVERGVHKAPANEVVRLAVGFEHLLNKSQQDVLNPEGVNCLRFFEGRGYRVWGARTISSDPEWKYVNLRRYFAFVEHSIDKGTQWAVFEPNGRVLWTKVRRTIEDFLFNEWVSGHLMGETPDEAYFVKCDRTTMTQNDFDNGRLICLIGIAPLRPAEFVIFRIGQKTLDFKL